MTTSNLFSNQKMYFPRNLTLSDFSSTLLIPDPFFNLFQSKIKKHKGIHLYISYLLKKYKLYIANGLVPAYSNVTTKYQERGQNLHKIAFRPKPDDWAELKLYRISFGMSISAFLVYLLKADSVDFAEASSEYLTSVGIIVVPDFDLCTKVLLHSDRSTYTIIFQYRRGKYH